MKIDNINAVTKEISNIDSEIKKTMTRQEFDSALEEFQERARLQATQYRYFVSYAVFGHDGSFKMVDNGFFFVDLEVVGVETMFKLDQTVAYFVKPKDGDFVKLLAWQLLQD